MVAILLGAGACEPFRQPPEDPSGQAGDSTTVHNPELPFTDGDTIDPEPDPAPKTDTDTDNTPTPTPSDATVFHCACLKQLYTIASIRGGPNDFMEKIIISLKMGEHLAATITLGNLHVHDKNDANILEFTLPNDLSIPVSWAEFLYQGDTPLGYTQYHNNDDPHNRVEGASTTITPAQFKKLVEHRLRSFGLEVTDGVYSGKVSKATEVFYVQKDKIYMGTNRYSQHVFKLDGALGQAGRLVNISFQYTHIGDDTNNLVKFSLPKNYQFKVESVDKWVTGQYHTYSDIFDTWQSLRDYYGTVLNEKPEGTYHDGVPHPAPTTTTLTLTQLKSAWKTYMTASQGIYREEADSTEYYHSGCLKSSLTAHTPTVVDTEYPDQEVIDLYQTLGIKSVQNPLSPPTDPYGNPVTLSLSGSPVAIVTTPASGQGAIQYRSTTSDECTVDATTGTITPVATGECIIEAQYVGDDDYWPSEYVEIFRDTVTP